MEDKKTVDEDVYNIKMYPKHLRKIVKVLMSYESVLSDGFEWYSDVVTITKLAQELYDLDK